MSLDSLLQKQHTTSAGSSNETTHCLGVDRTETELRVLSIALMDALVNAVDIESSLVKDMTSQRMITTGSLTGQVCRTLRETIVNTSIIRNEHPDYRLDFREDATRFELDGAKGWATVWLTASTSGYLAHERETRLQRETVYKLDWRWRGSLGKGHVGSMQHGRWQCIRMAGMMGSSGSQ